MATAPRISVVTCSFNQGHFINRTIESVLAQNYPNLEHIIVDGMSTDDTPEVLSRYPHLRVIRERDNGQSDAINKGFRHATGDILCFLNSDDTFMPGALQRVAQEIDPARGRHVVMGRCRFIDEEDNYLGIEHPSMFVSHRRVLEIWKGHCIPQPATFWTREVWDRCGPLDEREQLVMDYDLFCRFSKRYHFHWIDQVFANYRLHTQSKTISRGGKQVAEEALRVSRKYWGSRLTLQYWRLRWSLWISQQKCRERAMKCLANAKTFRERGGRQNRMKAAIQDLLSLAATPDVYADVVLLPTLEARFPNLHRKLGWLIRKCNPNMRFSQTLTFRGFDGVHVDNWVGPTLAVSVDVARGHSHVRLEGDGIKLRLGRLPEPLTIEFFLDDRSLGRYTVGRESPFAVDVPLGDVRPGRHELRLKCNTFIVGHAYLNNEDYRPLSFRLKRLEMCGRMAQAA